MEVQVAGGHDGGALPEDGIKIKKGKLKRRRVMRYDVLLSRNLVLQENSIPDAPEEGIYIFG